MTSSSFLNHVLVLVFVYCGEQISAQNGTIGPPISGYRTVCYTEGWAHSRHGPLHYDPSDVDTSLCTHVVFQYAVLDPTGLQILPRNQAVDPGLYNQLTALKTTNPQLKVMVTLGGYTMSSDEFTKTVSSTSNMRTFAANAVSFLNKYNFDGLDMDWEFPGDRGSPPEDKERYVQLLQIVQEAFNQNSTRPLILSIVMFPTRYRIGTSYKLPEIANYVDFINLKAFHLHGDWQGVAGHHSALYSSIEDETESIDYLVNWILQASVPREKLNLGIALYASPST